MSLRLPCFPLSLIPLFLLVTTTFSQGAVFYAGETVSCTIAFSNPLPTLPKPPSASSSSSSRRSASRRAHHTPLRTHSRSQSLTSDPTTLQPALQSPTNTVHSTTTSLTSLASSTFSFFTQRAPPQEPDPPPPSDALRAALPENTSHENGDSLIPIELGEGTPRSSIDTQASGHPALGLGLHGGHTNGGDISRRSSVDSLASYRTQQPGHPHPPPPHRLSQLLLKSTSSPSFGKKPEHLLWGFAQVVGNFIVDPSMINNNEFAPLKRRTMYRPGGMGGGGGLLAGGNLQNKIGKTRRLARKGRGNLSWVSLSKIPGPHPSFLRRPPSSLSISTSLRARQKSVSENLQQEDKSRTTCHPHSFLQAEATQ